MQYDELIHYTEKIIEVRAFITAFSTKRPKGYAFQGEMHDFWELVCLLEGRMLVASEERVRALYPGQIIFHKPLEFHRFWAGEESEPKILIISFKASGTGMSYFDNRLLTLTEEDKIQLFQTQRVCEKFLSLPKEKNEQYLREATKASLMMESLLFNLYGRKELPLSRHDRYADTFERIVQIMKEHCCERLSLEDMARLACLSVSSMKRIFKMYSDIGPIAYFNRIKIKKAMQELDNGASIADISEQLGFSDTSYFHLAFRQIVGMTPGEYRKRQQE